VKYALTKSRRSRPPYRAVRSFFAPRDQRRGVARVNRSAKKDRNGIVGPIAVHPGKESDVQARGTSSASGLIDDRRHESIDSIGSDQSKVSGLRCFLFSTGDPSERRAQARVAKVWSNDAENKIRSMGATSDRFRFITAVPSRPVRSRRDSQCVGWRHSGFRGHGERLTWRRPGRTINVAQDNDRRAPSGARFSPRRVTMRRHQRRQGRQHRGDERGRGMGGCRRRNIAS
jgi:hypothetical protein